MGERLPAADGGAKPWVKVAWLRTLAYFDLADDSPTGHDSAPTTELQGRPRARTKPTLHDELMREAGFETEYHEALAHRREARRARLRSTPSRSWDSLPCRRP
jgi:hypothetical protein